ncbi:MAG: hypothetical protein JW940_05205, partial [Polyangiaceae bacterium]|nr:hypothetical protein [Polyangiaceae bacterium]
MGWLQAFRPNAGSVVAREVVLGSVATLVVAPPLLARTTTMVSAKHLILAESGREVTTIHDFALGDG